MLEPVLGNVAIDEGVCCDAGKAKNKEQPQRNRGESQQQEIAKILAHEITHAGNIARFERIATTATRAKFLASK